MTDESPAQKFFASWKASLEILLVHYSKYAGGAMGGILTIVATIGFNFDKLGTMRWFEKSSLCGTLILLLLAVGNLLNCIVFATNTHLDLLRRERRAAFGETELVSPDALKTLDEELTIKYAAAQRFFAYGYGCISFAVLLAVVAFFIILAKT